MKGFSFRTNPAVPRALSPSGTPVPIFFSPWWGLHSSTQRPERDTRAAGTPLQSRPVHLWPRSGCAAGPAAPRPHRRGHHGAGSSARAGASAHRGNAGTGARGRGRGRSPQPRPAPRHRRVRRSARPPGAVGGAPQVSRLREKGRRGGPGMLTSAARPGGGTGHCGGGSGARRRTKRRRRRKHPWWWRRAHPRGSAVWVCSAGGMRAAEDQRRSWRPLVCRGPSVPAASPFGRWEVDTETGWNFSTLRPPGGPRGSWG